MWRNRYGVVDGVGFDEDGATCAMFSVSAKIVRALCGLTLSPCKPWLNVALGTRFAAYLLRSTLEPIRTCKYTYNLAGSDDQRSMGFFANPCNRVTRVFIGVWRDFPTCLLYGQINRSGPQ